jgi:predicted RNase H-like HicB family nuclease
MQNRPAPFRDGGENTAEAGSALEDGESDTIPFVDFGAKSCDQHEDDLMSGVRRFTAMIYRENGGYVALCPELDVASQRDSVEEASANLKEAVELFIESADPSEVVERVGQN